METDDLEHPIDTKASSAAPQQPSHLTAPPRQQGEMEAGAFTGPENKKKNDQLTTGLIVLIVVLLFIMLMLSINGKIFKSGANSQELTVLETQNAQLLTEVNAERARQGLAPLPAGADSARSTAARLQRDATSLTTMVSQWQKELATKDAAVDELQSQIASRDDNAKHLYSQIATLQNQIDESANAASQVASLSSELNMTKSQIEDYRKQLASLQGRPSQSEVSELRKQLNDSLENTGKLKMQIDGLLEAANNKADNKLYEEALDEIEKLRATNHSQRYEVQRLRALLDRARLFIESEEDLPADAARLFAKLRTLDNVRGPALAAAYESIGETHGARVIHRQSFATGSSQIAFDRETMIKNAMGKGAAADSFFLVVGYASKTGDAASNRKLSAARATTAASVVNLLKTEQQQVRAVYLGQTNRFSKGDSLENQICEVWEIKR